MALGDHRLVPDHPPLAHRLAGLVARGELERARRIDAGWLERMPAASRSDPFAVGSELLFGETRESGERALRRARGAGGARVLLCG